LVEDTANFFADGWIGLPLIRIEKRCNHIVPEIRAKICLDLVLQIVDLPLIEEVKGAVVIVHPCELRRNENFLWLRFNRARRDDSLSRFESSSNQRSAGFDADLDILVMEGREFVLPEQREKIVSVGERNSSPLNQLEKDDELALFESLPEGQLANPIFVEKPGKTI